MPKPDDDRPQPEPLPVRPPTMPPDFADIPQNPSSELQPPPDPSATPMVTISITNEAYAGIRSMLPKGVRTEPRLHEGGGGFKITLDRRALDRLAALRGPGESNSDVIVRLTSSGEPR
jgi:predicted CopG family antitoxin